MTMKDPHTELSDALRSLKAIKADCFFASNGRVYFGQQPQAEDIGRFYSGYHYIVDVKDAEDVAGQLNLAIRDAKALMIRQAEERLAKARQAIVEAAAA